METTKKINTKSQNNSIISISNGKMENTNNNNNQHKNQHNNNAINQINSSIFFNNTNYFHSNSQQTNMNNQNQQQTQTTQNHQNNHNINSNSSSSVSSSSSQKIGLANTAKIHKKERLEHQKQTVTRKGVPIGSRGQETDQHRIAQRQKQIDYGKNTLGYQEYCKAIPRENRKQGTDPQTPDIHLKISKRGFDGLVKIWRRGLHEYDPTKQDDEIEIDLDDIEGDQDFLAGKTIQNGISLGENDDSNSKEDHEIENENENNDDVHFKRKAIDKFEEAFV